MSCFSVKMTAAGPLHSFTGSNHGSTTASVKPPPTLQVKVNEIQKIQLSEKKPMNISRRDLALFLAAASFNVVTLSSPKPAEAAMSRDEMKKTILEKFKILIEKVGLSKPETEEKEKTELSKPETEEKEKTELSKPETKKNETTASPAPLIAEKKNPVLPTLPSIQNDKKIVVEAAPLP